MKKKFIDGFIKPLLYAFIPISMKIKDRIKTAIVAYK